MPNETRKQHGKKGGRPPVPEELRRQHAVTCRLTDSELIVVERSRGGMSRGEWLRTSALRRPPVVIPALNQKAWAYLQKVGEGIRYLIDRSKEGEPVALDQVEMLEVKTEMRRVQATLIGTKVSAVTSDPIKDVLAAIGRLTVGMIQRDGVGSPARHLVGSKWAGKLIFEFSEEREQLINDLLAKETPNAG